MKNIIINSQFTSFQKTHGDFPKFSYDRYGHGASPELMEVSYVADSVAEFIEELKADCDDDSGAFVWIGDCDGTSMACSSFTVYVTAAGYPWKHAQAGVLRLPGRSYRDDEDTAEHNNYLTQNGM